MKVAAKVLESLPTIVITLTDNGPVVRLEGWRHGIMIRQLEGLDLRIQQAMHQWAAKFVARDSASKLGAPPNAESRDDQLNAGRSMG